MGEILGIGMTHAPHLQFTDENMANVLRRLLKSDRTPAAMKDPQNWPAGMRAEWGNDEGLSAALDAFKPDCVLIWGDDQYENFREDVIPPFCIYAFDHGTLTAKHHFLYPDVEVDRQRFAAYGPVAVSLYEAASRFSADVRAGKPVRSRQDQSVK